MARNEKVSPKEARLRGICNSVKNEFRKAIEERLPIELGIIQALLDDQSFVWNQIVDDAIRKAEMDRAHSTSVLENKVDA